MLLRSLFLYWNVISFIFCIFTDSAFHSGSEDEEEDDHIRPPLGLSSLLNGPESGGPLGTSDLSVQSMSTDSKTGHDDSDQVSIFDHHP